MKGFAKHLFYKGNALERQNILWNIAGSSVYAFSSMLLSFFVIRLAGGEDGGIFSFGYSTLGQQLFIVAYFGLRPFHITDIREEFSFGDYRRHRIFTCILAFVVGAGYLGFMADTGRYGAHKVCALLLLAFYKILDGFADVYESEFQRRGCLYLTGKSLLLRTLFSVTVFLSVLKLTKSLLFSCACLAGAGVLGVILFDSDCLSLLAGVRFERSLASAVALTRKNIFLFVSVFLDFYIFSAAKYAIDARLGDAASGYFNLIFMPASVIYMIANFFIRPFLTKLTSLWENGELTDFKNGLIRLGILILGLALAGTAASLLLGGWALSVMERLLGPEHAGKLTSAYVPLCMIVFGGGLYAAANLLYYALVIMRRQGYIFAVYLCTAAAGGFLSGRLVGLFGFVGASACYVALMAAEAAGFGVCTVRVYRKRARAA